MIKNMKVVRTTLPCAFICTNDSSLNYPNHGRKSVQHNKIYLKDNEEFEIELYNPMSENVLAIISLDGKPISSSGIVIRAGQRFYLDCFYDDKKKFVYRTYEIDNTSEAKEATAKNGLFEVQFYKEKILKKYEADKIVQHHHHYHNNYYPRPYWNGWYNGFYYVNGLLSGGTVTTNGLYNSTTTNLNTLNINGTTTASYTSNNATFTSNAGGGSITTSNFSNNIAGSQAVNDSYSSSSDNLSFNTSSLRGGALKNETGQVDKGDNSSQSFTTVDMDFEDSMLNKISYQLLPESKKPVDFNATVNKIKLQADDIELNGNVKINGQSVSGSKVSQLLELKAMLESNLITQSEFDILKSEIMS